MYVPGNDWKKINKIPFLKADSFILDCEDGVALNRKVGIIILLQSVIFINLEQLIPIRRRPEKISTKFLKII